MPRAVRRHLVSRLANAAGTLVILVVSAVVLMACWAPAYVGATDRSARLEARRLLHRRLTPPGAKPTPGH